MTVTPLIAGNWKMNTDLASARALAAAVANAAVLGADLLVCPPFPWLSAVGAALGTSSVALGAQDCHPAAAGAHTGDVSAVMLAELGCQAVIVGHSERRADYGESDALVRDKAAAAQTAGMKAVICVGETEAERAEGNALSVVARQLASSIPPGACAENTVIAYEPVWAIGSGRTPSEEDVAAMHRHMRLEIAGLVATSRDVRLIYGGSVKPVNAAALLAAEDVNGALVGGASLTADDFLAIAAAV